MERVRTQRNREVLRLTAREKAIMALGKNNNINTVSPTIHLKVYGEGYSLASGRGGKESVPRATRGPRNERDRRATDAVKPAAQGDKNSDTMKLNDALKKTQVADAIKMAGAGKSHDVDSNTLKTAPAADPAKGDINIPKLDEKLDPNAKKADAKLDAKTDPKLPKGQEGKQAIAIEQMDKKDQLMLYRIVSGNSKADKIPKDFTTNPETALKAQDFFRAKERLVAEFKKEYQAIHQAKKDGIEEGGAAFAKVRIWRENAQRDYNNKLENLKKGLFGDFLVEKKKDFPDLTKEDMQEEALSFSASFILETAKDIDMDLEARKSEAARDAREKGIFSRMFDKFAHAPRWKRLAIGALVAAGIAASGTFLLAPGVIFGGAALKASGLAAGLAGTRSLIAGGTSGIVQSLIDRFHIRGKFGAERAKIGAAQQAETREELVKIVGQSKDWLNDKDMIMRLMTKVDADAVTYREKLDVVAYKEGRQRLRTALVTGLVVGGAALGYSWYDYVFGHPAPGGTGPLVPKPPAGAPPPAGPLIPPPAGPPAGPLTPPSGVPPVGAGPLTPPSGAPPAGPLIPPAGVPPAGSGPITGAPSTGPLIPPPAEAGPLIPPAGAPPAGPDTLKPPIVTGPDAPHGGVPEGGVESAPKPPAGVAGAEAGINATPSLKPSAGISPIEVADKPGDGIWKLLERQLEKRVVGWDTLQEGQRTGLIDTYKNQVAADLPTFKLENIDQVKLGQSVDFSSLFEDRPAMQDVIDKIKAWEQVKITRVEGNNRILEAWVTDNPGSALTSERAEEILLGTSAAQSSVIADAPTSVAAAVAPAPAAASATEGLATGAGELTGTVFDRVPGLAMAQAMGFEPNEYKAISTVSVKTLLEKIPSEDEAWKIWRGEVPGAKADLPHEGKFFWTSEYAKQIRLAEFIRSFKPGDAVSNLTVDEFLGRYGVAQGI